MTESDAQPTDHAPSTGFWPARCGAFTKELLLLALVTGFIVQTCLVYSDVHDTVALNEQQIAGRRIWLENNCQTCHQLHGFGGFLGPDLTNAVTRLERVALDSRLTEGSEQMPAFNMNQDEIEAVWAFLTAMNETGIGQARNPNIAGLRVNDTGDAPPPVTASTPAEALLQVIDESDDAAVQAGLQLFRTRACLGCHVLYGRSSVGAPDLSLSGLSLTPDEILTTLQQGRPPKMPPPALSAAERQSVRAFIIYMAEHRAETLARVEAQPQPFWLSLPWWEY